MAKRKQEADISGADSKIVQSDTMPTDPRVQVVLASGSDGSGSGSEGKKRRRVYTDSDMRGLMNKIGDAAIEGNKQRAARDRFLAAGNYESAAAANARATTALDKRFAYESAMIEAKIGVVE